MPDTTKTDENFTDLLPMPPPQGDEKVKEGQRLKILTPNKLLNRLPILLAQKKPETIDKN